MTAMPPSPYLSPPPDERPPFTVRDLLTLLFKHRWLILGMWVLVTLVGAWSLHRLPASYVAQAKLLIKTEQQGQPSPLSGITAYRDGQDLDPSIRKLETEMDILLSRPLVAKVVEQLQLRHEQVYHPPYAHLLAPVLHAYGALKRRLFGGDAPETNRFDETVDALMKSIVVAPAKSRSGEATPNLISLQVITADPSVADQALTALIAQYVAFSNRLEEQDSARVYKLVKARVTEAAAEVQAAQQRLERLSAGARTVEPMAAALVPGSGAPSPPNRGDPRSESPNPQAPQLLAPAESVSALLRRRLTQLELDLIEQQQVYTTRMESVATLKAQIAQVRSRLETEIRKAARESTEMQSLQRELRLAETNHQELERKLTQIDLFLQINPEQSSTRVVVEPARRPSASEWKKQVLVGIAISVAGLMLALAMAALREFTDHRLQNPDDVQRHLGMPVLSSLNWLTDTELQGLDARVCSARPQSEEAA